METTPYETVLNGTADLCGLDRANLSPFEFRILRDFHSNRLQMAYEYDYWPSLKLIQKRYFRPLWEVGSTYDATDEVYWPGTRKYYQSLIDTNIGNVPADEDGVTDFIWAECATSYEADNYSSTTAYVQGAIVYYPTTDLYYQLWEATSTGNLPTDGDYWGALTPFDKYVDYEQAGKTAIGRVYGVTTDNPRLSTRYEDVSYSLSEVGIQVNDSLGHVWVEFQRRVPILKGDAYSATIAYAVGDQMYFTDGDFYDCIDATTAGQTPVTHAAKWSIVEIPLIFELYLEHSAHADWLYHRRSEEDAIIKGRFAESLLADKSSALHGLEGQMQKPRVLTR